MSAEIKFGLAPDGGQDKGFLSGAFVEREDSDTVAIGVAHRDGHGYAFARVSKKQFWAAMQTLFPEEFE